MEIRRGERVADKITTQITGRREERKAGKPKGEGIREKREYRIDGRGEKAERREKSEEAR